MNEIKQNNDFDMLKLAFPLDFEFKITTLSNDFVAKDVHGKTIAYVRQKMFRLKEAVSVFNNESRSQELFHIKADCWIDFNAHYDLINAETNESIGSLGRKGMKSLWKARYTIYDTAQQATFEISEMNPWTKVADGVVGEIPIVSFFTGYLFHPKYGVYDQQGNLVAQLSKLPSFWGRRFKLEEIQPMSNAAKCQIMLCMMMVVLLERERG